MTDDAPPPDRPNANYKLSNSEKKLGSETPVFYYNRERRLEKAPQAVKDLYAQKDKPAKFGLFGTLVSSKSKTMLFVTIVVLCVIILFLSIFDRLDTSYSLEGNSLRISGTIYEDNTIVILRKTISKDKETPYTGTVDIAVSPIVEEEGEYQVFFHRVFFTLEKTEEYRFVVPFDVQGLLVIVDTGRTSVNMVLKPE